MKNTKQSPSLTALGIVISLLFSSASFAASHAEAPMKNHSNDLHMSEQSAVGFDPRDPYNAQFHSDKKHHKMAKPTEMKKAMPVADTSLYSRLGGWDAIVAVVDDFVGNVAADKRINSFFANTDIARLKQLLVEQICAGSGGPCSYTGRSMKDTHRGMGVQNNHFGALVEDLVKTLDKFGVPTKEKNELLGILGPMQADIVQG